MKHKFKPGAIVWMRPYNLNISGKIKYRRKDYNDIYHVMFYSKALKGFSYVNFLGTDMKLTDDQIDHFF